MGLAPRHLLMLTITAASLIPLVFMIMTSLKSPNEYLNNQVGLPQAITFENYVNALVGLPVLTWAKNSLIVTLSSVLIATTFGALAGFAIAFGEFRGRKLLYGASIALIMVPPIVLMLPMFITMVDLGLIDSLPSVVIFYSCLMTPFSVFFFVNFFGTIPQEVLESSVVDGAGPLRALWSIVLPISKPAVLTLAVVNAVWAWNELLIALVFLQSEQQRTLMAGMTQLQGRFVTNQPLVLAVAVLSIIPIAVFYIFSQRTFVQGITAGVGK